MPFYADALARIHHEGYESHALAAAPRVLAILRRAGVRTGRVADLGCGAGPLSEVLVRRGYDVLGVDVSATMIRLAQSRVPEARFVRASISDVALPPLDAAVAVGEILNYVPRPADVRRVLGRVFAALRPGGVFVFDALLPRPRRTRVAARDERDWAIVAKMTESPTRVRRDITTFVRSGRAWRRGREVHEQRLYPTPTLSRWLRSAGFRVRSERLDDAHALFAARKSRDP